MLNDYDNLALVSVIVPVYNIEKYISKCVESIIDQTYTCLEIILIDDGSTDHSSFICNSFREKDNRIKVIHKPNGGLSDARNAGLDAATGEYVTFIDGDDWYKADAIERLITAAKEHNADIVAMGAAIVSPDCSEERFEHPDFKVESSKEYFVGICNGVRTPSVCTKLIKRSLIESQRFLKGRLNEDFYFTLNLLFAEATIVTIAYAGYFYYQRPGSITHSGSKRSLADAILNCIDLMEIAESRDQSLLQSIARMGLHQASVMIRVIPDKRISRENQYLILALSCIQICSPYLSDSGLSLFERMIIKSASVAPLLTAKSLRIIRVFRR